MDAAILSSNSVLIFFCKLYKLKVLRCFIIPLIGGKPWALIADNVEERFNYRNKERVDRGRDDEKSSRNAFVLEMTERFSSRYEDTIY